MTVRELKEWLRVRGADTAGAVEKGDLVAQARELASAAGG